MVRLRQLFRNIDLQIELDKEEDPEVQTCAEVETLKQMFQELITTKRFEVNDFLEKED